MEDGAIFHLPTKGMFTTSVPVLAIIDHGVQLPQNMMVDGEAVKVRKRNSF